MATEADTKAGLAHPEAELMAAAGESERPRVKLCVTNVYNSNQQQLLTLDSTSTVGDLKRLIQDAFESQPAPHQQRLIFRGKQCEETQQLAHVLRGADLSAQQNLHLVVTQPAEPAPRPAGPIGAPDVAGEPATEGADQSQSSKPPPPIGSNASSSGLAPGVVPSGVAKQPELLELNTAQVAQLQWQYQQALRENQRALQQHQEQYQFLACQSMALTRQQGSPLSSAQAQPQQQQQQLSRPSAAVTSEVATAVATRALGGNMPGPAAGGGVRDVTGPPPPGFIPAAGLGENGQEGRGNLTDPAPRAGDVRREARGYFKMVMQCIAVVVVFGIDGWMLVALVMGGFAMMLFKMGVVEWMLGGRHEGGGLWGRLGTAATVVTEGGGVLADIRFFFCAVVFSIFPTWKPVRSPEAIAAEAAARAAEAAAAAELAEQLAEAVQAASAAAQAADAAPADQGGEGQGGEEVPVAVEVD